MSFWEAFGIALSSAGLLACVLGAFLTYAARQNGQATRNLIRTMEERLTTLLEHMDKRSVDMEQRAEQRHQEIIETIRALRAT